MSTEAKTTAGANGAAVSGDTLTVEGNGHFIDGGNIYGGFFLQSGTATFADLAVRNMLERGGNGGNGIHANTNYYGGGGAGGGGLGAGGAFFIGSGGAATLKNVSVTGNSAVGGNGGTGFGGINPQHNGGPIAGQGGWLNGWTGISSGGSGSTSFSGFSGSIGGCGGGTSGHPSAPESGGGGGGAAGLGGGIFVSTGGSLTLTDGDTVDHNNVTGGLGGSGPFGAGSGVGIGNGIFTTSSNVTLAPSAGPVVGEAPYQCDGLGRRFTSPTRSPAMVGLVSSISAGPGALFSTVFRRPPSTWSAPVRLRCRRS